MNFLLILLLVVLSSSVFAGSDENEKEKLNFGVFPYIGVNHIVKTYAPLKEYIEQNVNVDVVIVTAKDFKKFVSRTSKKEYDLIFTAPHFALKAEKELSYERLIRFSGSIEAQVVVASDSQLKNVSDLNEKIVYSPDSMAIISLLGKDILTEAGLVVGVSVFVKPMLSHRNVLLSVLKDHNSAGLVSSNVMQRFSAKTPGLRVIASGKKIPAAMFMMNTELSQSMKMKLQMAMSQFPESVNGKKFFNSMPLNGLQKITDNDMQQLSVYASGFENTVN